MCLNIAGIYGSQTNANFPLATTTTTTTTTTTNNNNNTTTNDNTIH